MSAPAQTSFGIRDHYHELVQIRRDIHAHPELGMEEKRTSKLVADTLKGWGIDHVTGIGKYGVVATIQGKLPGQRRIGLRADMDALPIDEQTGVPHASKTPGLMHACGHDGHTTMLLGAARHLIEHRDFAGTVHLIFQPAEEGRGGAVAMLADRLFERFPCEAIYGLHNMPGYKAGTFVTTKGAFMAGGGSWRVRFKGSGGHGGMPHRGTDLSLVQAHFVLGLQTVMTRNMMATDAAVITVGFAHAGSLEASNVMPSEFLIGGTMRYFDPKIKTVLEQRIEALAKHCAALHGATAEVDFNWMAVPVINQAAQTDVAAAAAAAIVGHLSVNTKAEAVTGGEDFSFMMEKVPGAFMFIGNGVNDDGTAHHLHTPHYEFNDEIIPLGVAYWVELVKQELQLAA